MGWAEDFGWNCLSLQQNCDNDNGSSTIGLRDGSRMTAEGQGVEVAKKVLVKNRVIVRDLPDLPVYRVQV